VVRLGLLSTARINNSILAAAAASDRVEAVAVASRDADRADAYAREHRLAREEARPAHAVAPDVHERSAVELGSEPHVIDVLQPEPERRVDRAEPADRPVRQELGDAAPLWVVAVHERLHQHEARPVGEVEGIHHVRRAA
jgi:hypothetical protein